MNGKLLIYSVLPRLMGRDDTELIRGGSIRTNGCGKMADFTPELLNEIRRMGFTHVWFIGLIEHASTTPYPEIGVEANPQCIVKGRAGSPYAVRDYFDIDPDLACCPANRMKEFEALVHRVHDAGMRFVMDFIPNHVARCYRSDVRPKDIPELGADDDTRRAFSPQNNFYYFPGEALQLPNDNHGWYELPALATGNDCFRAKVSGDDWYEAVKLNYGVDYLGGGQMYFQPIPNTWHRMLEILCYWSARGVDGFRCDMVEMVPPAFWQWAIPQVKARHPDVVFIAEIYQPSAYRAYVEAGFDYLYDKTATYDTLRRVLCHHAPAYSIGDARYINEGLHERMISFLENHDEQRVASDFFCGDAFAARPAMAYIALNGSGPLMIYFAQTLGERGMDTEGFSGCDGRTTIFDYWHLDKWRRYPDRLTDEEKRLHDFYRRLLGVAHRERTVSEGGYYDLMFAQKERSQGITDRVHLFVRHCSGEWLLVAANYSAAELLIGIYFPPEFFEAVCMPVNVPLRQTDLFSNEGSVVALTPYAPYQIRMDAHNIRIIRFILQE